MGRTLGALALAVAILLSALAVTVPAVGAQGNKGGTSAAAKVCQQEGFQNAYTMVGGAPVGFANAGECISATTQGAQLGVSSLTATSVLPTSVHFEGTGLLPGAEVILSVLLADHTVSVVELAFVSSSGTVNVIVVHNCIDDVDVVGLTVSTLTASGAPIAATGEVAGECSP